MLKYASNTPLGGAQAVGLASYNVGLGIGTDVVYGKSAANPGGSAELTTAWSVAASYEHNWNPNWKTSIYGTYLAVSFNQNAQTLICANLTGSAATAGAVNATAATLNCSPNWQVWEVGSRTQWNVTRGLYMGVDVLYRKLETGFAGYAVRLHQQHPAADWRLHGGEPGGAGHDLPYPSRLPVLITG